MPTAVPTYRNVRVERLDTHPATMIQFDKVIGRSYRWPEATFNRPSICAVPETLARFLLNAQPDNFRLAVGAELTPEDEWVEPGAPPAKTVDKPKLNRMQMLRILAKAKDINSFGVSREYLEETLGTVKATDEELAEQIETLQGDG